MSRPKKPVTIRGVTYESQKAAAAALRLVPSTVSLAVKYGFEDRLGITGRKVGGRPGNPITIKGVTYPSQIAAAKALGLSPCTITARKAAGRLEE